VIEDFASQEECAGLRERAEEIIQEFDPKTLPVFSTKDQASVFR
jgi:phytanoyl-CoA hydroxylase